MLLMALQIIKDWTKNECAKDGSLLSKLRACFNLVPKGQAVSLVALTLATAYFEQIYDDQFILISVVATSILLWKARRWLRLPLLCFAGYLVFAALWHFGVGDNLSPKLQSVSAAVMGRHTLFVILLGTAAIAIAPSLRLLAPMYLLMAAVMSFIGFPVLKNSSTNAAAMMLALPYCTHWLAWVLAIAVLLTQQGATAYLMLGAISLMTVYKNLSRKYLCLLVTTIAGLAVLESYRHPAFFIFYDRWDEYKLAARFWWENINPWIGAGLGTFQVLGPVMQKWDGQPVTEVWMSLHSDWLQLIFECGAIGGCLGAWLLIDSILRAESAVRISLIAACLFGLFYFPMQIPLVAFYLILTVVGLQKKI